MTIFLLLATAAAGAWVVLAARKQTRRSRPDQTVDNFHRTLAALSNEHSRPRRR